MRSMRTWIIALAVAVTAAVGGIAIPFHSAVAQAAQNIPLAVGTLDIQVILTKSKAGQSLEKVLQDRSKAVNAEIGKTEQSLRAKAQKLEQSRSSLAPADFQAQRTQLNTEFEAFRKSANTKRKELVLAKNKGLDQIFKVLDGVIKEIAQKRGLTLIINKSLVVMAAEAWDITKEVQQGLDAKLPKVSI